MYILYILSIKLAKSIEVNVIFFLRYGDVRMKK